MRRRWLLARTAHLDTAHLNAVGTAVPPHDVHQAFIDLVPDLLSDDRARRTFERMSARSSIEHRYSSLEAGRGADGYDVEGFYRRGAFPSTAARMARFERDAPALVDAALRDLERRLDPGWQAGVTHLVITTCTGFAAPGLDAYLVRRHGLDSRIERSILGFMGCNAGMNALKLARHIVRSEPAARVLVLNVELCTLHLQDRMPLETALMFLLFADGAAASLVSREPVGLELTAFASDITADTEDKMTWRIGDSGFDMWLSGEVPRLIAASLPAHVAALRERLRPEPAALWAVHPGGRSILDAVESSLGLAPEDLAASRQVLRDYGNMSSATLGFVLQRLLASPGAGRSGVATGFGPGLSIESMLFREAAA
jgi:predicted naringenin-chalcone synthase